MIELRGVVKRHSDEVCIGPVDLDIQAGGVTALVGPNGAGKSTLITILCGLRRADSGTVTICGHHPGSPGAARSIGYAPQELGIYPDLSVAQNLAAFGELPVSC